MEKGVTGKSIIKKGFTLAETLITLGIIGIVAAMTLPTLIHNYKAKVLEQQFKKAYSNVQQAFVMTKNNLGIDNVYTTYTYFNGSEYPEYPNAKEFVNEFTKNLNATKIVDFYSVKNYNGTKTMANENVGNDYPCAQHILQDGSSFGLHINYDGNHIGIWIFIDTNGPYKKPNQYGHDIFKFEIDQTDKLVPLKTLRQYTQEELENSPYPELIGYPCDLISTQATNGAGCSYYAVNNICPSDETKNYFECLP